MTTVDIRVASGEIAPWRPSVAVVLCLAAAIAFPFLAPNQYIVHLGVMALIYAILAVSLNVVAGFAGLLSLGHAAFFGIGAYASTLSAMRWGLPVPVALLWAGVVSSAFGIFLAIPSLKVRGIYFKVVTLAFGLIMHILFVNLDWLTGGAQGIFGIPRPILFGMRLMDARYYYLYTLVFFALAVLTTARLVKSPYGRSFVALRDNEMAAACSGIDARRVKFIAFMVSTFLAGVAGALYAHYVRFINPDAFTVTVSLNLLVMIVIGGLGNIAGSIVGATLVSVLPEALRFAQTYYYAVFGIVLVVVIVFAPEGLVALAGRVVRRLGAGRHSAIRPHGDLEG